MRTPLVHLTVTLLLTLACSGLVEPSDHAYATPTAAPDAGSSHPTAGAPAGSPPSTAAGDFSRWDRYRLIDAEGFGTPIEAMSFLLPQGWTQDAAVRWQATPCMGEMMQAQGRWRSPDGAIELIFHPTQMWEFSPDPYIQQRVQMSGAGIGPAGCRFRPATDAHTWVKNEVLPALHGPNAGTPTFESFPEEEREIAANFRKDYPQGLDVEISLSRADLDVGRERTTVLAGLLTQTTGAPIRQTIQTTFMLASIRGPADRHEELDSILSTFVSSQVMHPQWDQAVQNFVREVSRNNRQAIAERSRIHFETSTAIADDRMRSWEARMDSQSRGAAQFSQAIRGVETWSAPDGSQIELSHGHQNAWRGADGSYLLSDDPNFDPRRSLEGTWDPLIRAAP